MQWDIFCRVVDNFGDIGVCWRLAADLGSRGESVRLWVDDASALAWLAPHGASGVQTHGWHEADAATAGDVVVEAFGCDPPAPFVERMPRMAPAPVWINLEYLSAEAYVERSHGLASPVMAGPGRGLTKWFFYPGFTERTGGLIREHRLMQKRAAFDASQWLAEQGIESLPNERLMSLFCYADAPVEALIERAAASSTLLLATPGHASRLAQAALGPSMRRGLLRCIALPWLTQPQFDRLLWACDLNFVRGEDSFVRAQWAGNPFVWQAYPQDDGVHLEKVDAFLARHLDDAPASTAAAIKSWWTWWNGAGPLPRGSDGGDETHAWETVSKHWTQSLAAAPDLTTRLLGFVKKVR